MADNMEFNDNKLTGMISSAVNTRLARVLLIEGVVGNDQISLRIQEEFQALRSNLLAGIAPPVEEGAMALPVSSPVEVALRREMLLMRKENKALAKENKRDVLRYRYT